MLTEKELLLLCEFSCLTTISKGTDTLVNVAESLIGQDNTDRNEFLKEVISSSNLAALSIKNAKDMDRFRVFIYEDTEGNIYAVFIEGKLSDYVDKDCFERVVEFINDNKETGKCFITGLKAGGIYASYVASYLNIEAVIFGAPSTEELSGKVKNYIAENDPVGEFCENILFVKQKTDDEYTEENFVEILDKPYSQTFMFDENGRAVISEQSMYSKFISWFYNNANNINSEVWEMFYPNSCEDDVFLEKSIYSAFFRVEELNTERINKSLTQIVRYINDKLEKNLRSLDKDFEIIMQEHEFADEDYQKKISEITEYAANNACEFIKEIYKSVETVLIGIGLFTLENGNIDINEHMEKFSEEIDNILKNETGRITDHLASLWQKYLDCLAIFPDD